MNPRPRPILWDIYEEHLGEAAFLFQQWEEAMSAAVYAVPDVIVGPEERLVAHLDGLVLGESPVANKLLFPALEDDDRGKIFAAAWSLIHAEDADHFPRLSAALLSGKPEARDAVARAFELGVRTDLAKKTTALWDTADPASQAAILDVANTRDAAWTRGHVFHALASPDPRLLAAGLRAARRHPDLAFAGYADQALRHESAPVRAEALATAFLFGTAGLWDACRHEAAAGTTASRLPLALLALRGIGPADPMFQSMLADPEKRRHALWALGFAGTVEAMDVLVPYLEDEECGRAAGEAMNAITGVVIAGPFSKAGETKGANVEVEVGPDDAPPEVTPEEHLLIPNAKALAAFWNKVRGQLTPGRHTCTVRPEIRSRCGARSCTEPRGGSYRTCSSPRPRSEAVFVSTSAAGEDRSPARRKHVAGALFGGGTMTRSGWTKPGGPTAGILAALMGASACTQNAGDPPKQPPPPSASPTAQAIPAAPSAAATASADAPTKGGPSPGSAANDAKATQAIWRGGSGGWSVTWTTRELLATKDGESKPVFSLTERWRTRHEAELAEEAKERTPGDPPNPCLLEMKGALLSFVGSYLSFEEASYASCEAEAHPGGETRWVTVDLSQSPPKAVMLTALFPETAVSAALAADKLVRRGIDGPTPRKLDELVQALADSPPVLGDGLCYSFDADLPEHFAIHHVEKDQTFVRVGLPGAATCRYDLTQVGLALKTPAKLKAQVTAAQDRSAGILLEEARKLGALRTEWKVTWR